METQNCAHCGAQFEITDDDISFYKKISPILPLPTHCPDCRQQRRLASINERYLYRGQCGLCHKSTLTQYPPHLTQTIYCRECWHSDKWDSCDYGKDFDFSRPFFEQFRELQKNTPVQALHIDGTCVNSEYMHYAGSCKNCYLIAHADFCEDCYYGYGFKNDTSCVDGFYNLHCELCYDCVDVHKCYALKASQDCISCNSSAFLRDCIGCKNCFLCTGLRNKEFYFENKKLSQEEYKKRIGEIDLGSYSQYQECKKRLRELELQHTFKALHGYNLENSFGDYLVNSKNANFCFDCEEVESAKFCYQLVLGSKDVCDIYQYGTGLQQSYECVIAGDNSYHILFTSNASRQCSELLYCYYMESSHHCFGCVSMHNRSYCILNKQYSKDEYEVLVPKIIEHMKKRRAHGASAQAEGASGFASANEAEPKNQEWGEYFPPSISFFGYNKTTAQMYYSLTKEQVLAEGWQWDDYEPPQPEVAKIISTEKLPDNIKDIGDDILNAAVKCEVTKKLFKITPQELKFYRQWQIPVPRRHPEERHLDRFHKRNPRKFWQRRCTKCGGGMLSTFEPSRPEIVCCEKCYLETIY